MYNFAALQQQQAGGWGGIQLQAAQAAAAQQPQAGVAANAYQLPGAAAAATDGTIGSANNILVSGCTHPTVGPTARGTFTHHAENHGRRAFKRDGQVNGLDVMIYFWDARDGAAFSGWWFGPKIGGDQVWAYHPDTAAQNPPKTGWKVPYDGPVDPTLTISPSNAADAAKTAAQPQLGGLAGMQSNPLLLQQQQVLLQQQQQQQQQQMLLQQQKTQQAQATQAQEQQRKQMMEQMRLKQMEEQKRRLEENKKKLEELNMQRVKEQQAKMAAMKQQQEALKAKAAEDAKARMESQKASLALRKACQKMRNAMPATINELKQELAELIQAELHKCGPSIESIKKECEAATVAAETRLKTIEDAKRKEEERKAAAEQKQKEQEEKVARLIQEFSTLVEDAEETFKLLSKEVQPLLPTPDEKEVEMTVEQIQAAVATADAASIEVKAKCKACMDFMGKNASDMRSIPKPKIVKDAQSNEPEKPTQQALALKVSEVTKQTEALMKTVNISKVKAIKKAEAKKQMSLAQKTFAKYDRDRDGVLSKKEFMALAKGEFSFTIPVADADSISKLLIEDGKKGVPYDSFQRLKAYIAIAQEKVRDAKRKEARIAKEAELVEKKVKLSKVVDEVGEVITEATDKIKECESAASPLLAKVKGMKSQEMGPLADEVSTAVTEAKEMVAKAKKMLEELSDDVEDELKVFATGERNKLTARMIKFDGQITVCDSQVSKFRAEASKKNDQELEAIRLRAIKIIRSFQQKKALKVEELLKAFGGKSTVSEKQLVAFFSKANKELDDGESDNAHDEISSDDASRLFTYLDEEKEGSLSRDVMMSVICNYLKVVKESVITTEKSIKDGKPLRRLELNEVCELLEGPIKDDDVDIMRVRVKVLKDNVEGWLTIVGNQGTAFLEYMDGGVNMKVVKETILTPNFSISGEGNKEQARKLKDNTRKLKEGEIVEVRQWMKKEESSGLMRMKVKTKSDGQLGWATAIGNAGAVFLELV